MKTKSQRISVRRGTNGRYYTRGRGYGFGVETLTVRRNRRGRYVKKGRS